MITINNLQKNFGTTVASSIEYFEITDGEILGLVGNNGAGKTTLFRLMLDLLKADSGFVTIDGINPSENEDWKQHVGAYIDEGFLIDFLTPEEYFAFLGKVSGMTKEQSEKRMEDFTDFAAGEIFGQKKLIRNLSAGNKQKVGIISALYRRPSIVILDEPFNIPNPSIPTQAAMRPIDTPPVRRTAGTPERRTTYYSGEAVAHIILGRLIVLDQLNGRIQSSRVLGFLLCLLVIRKRLVEVTAVHVLFGHDEVFVGLV